MSKRPSTIQVGERVKIITPDFFVRCGYPWNKQYALENLISKADSDELEAFVSRLCGGSTPDAFFNKDQSAKTFGVMMDRLAWGVLKKHGYGGKVRSIHTKRLDEFAGRIFTVDEKKVVNTGSYVSGGWCGSYDDPSEYDAPYLTNRASHVILTLNPYFENDRRMLASAIDEDGFPLRIEAKNVEVQRNQNAPQSLQDGAGAAIGARE